MESITLAGGLWHTSPPVWRETETFVFSFFSQFQRLVRADGIASGERGTWDLRGLSHGGDWPYDCQTKICPSHVPQRPELDENQGCPTGHLMSQTNEFIHETFSDPATRIHQFSDHRPLPDIASFGEATPGGKIDRVGMSDIETVVRLRSADRDTMLAPALAKAFVSLEPEHVKGIHMSRLFLLLQEELADEPLTPRQLAGVLKSFVASHARMSRSAFLAVSFQHVRRQRSLVSQIMGWRHYPIQIDAELRDGRIRLWLHARITYSSTCPCSAALARQLLEQRFQEEHAFHQWVSVSQVMDWINTNGSMATPHAQRSFADVCVELPADCEEFPIDDLIARVEGSLNTPVQSVVKREDEQEFARLNGENLMFCEDAVRRIKSELESCDPFVDFRIESNHMESLHPHNAIAVSTMGRPGGLRP